MRVLKTNLFSLLSLTLLAGFSSHAGHLPQALQEIESKYSHSGTVSADFTQINEEAAFNRKKVSSGKIQVKRPGKMRWETEKPEPSILLSDGKIFWFYTPPFDESEKGQVIVKKSSQVQSKLANALLSGSFSGTKGMLIQEQSPTTFILKPKPGTAGTVVKAKIEIDLEKKLIKKITLTHKGGNQSEISLSHIELGKALADDVFRFKLNENTDLIEE